MLGPGFLGCIEAIEPHLPTLIPYLISTLNDPKVSYSRLVQYRSPRKLIYYRVSLFSLPTTLLQPLVRSITCWTLGRYASWCTIIPNEEHKNSFFVPTMEGVRQFSHV